MLAQSIIDTIIDLAIPVVAAYQDAIGALEMDVLTEPNIKHARELYVITSEIDSIQNSISPIAGLITSLQDSRSGLHTKSTPQDQVPILGVKISPMTQVYLGDVKDHCFLISQTLDQLHLSAQGMINLIFNTITAYQNETMKKLTGTTIMFLPLTFVTGYFGMNLTDFPSLENNESFFWAIATPVALGTALLLGWGKFWRRIVRIWQRRRFTKKPGS
jgi:Mg2+ and Co2+ transporter CorA